MSDTIGVREPDPSEPRIGLALSGGGSRAIAFHLGAMRALERMGLLKRVSVISTVSGGSVIGALWAYSDEPFDVFERRIVKLLRKGLVRDIFIYLFHPVQLAKWLLSLIANAVAFVVIALRSIASLAGLGLGKLGIPTDWIASIQPPLCRWATRTSAFELMLHCKHFGGKRLNAPTRNGREIVINAAELTTGASFRFGVKEAGTYRLGFAKSSDIAVATAVASSAAFPILLPALDLRLKLKLGDKPESWERVLLSDGGVIDNLGISVFERREKTPFVYEVDYILSSSAGQGRPEGRTLPYWLLPRLVQVSMIQFRKLQDAGLKILYWWKASGSVKEFALAYLGQDDSKVVPKPAEGLVPKERVDRYPTNFSAMSQNDLDALSMRGEQLMEAMVRRHCPSLVKQESAGGTVHDALQNQRDPWL